MNKPKRVGFLRYFNDYRILVLFTVDYWAVALGSFVLTYSALNISGAPLYITILGSLFATVLWIYLYSKAKEDTSKGFLKHWAYSKGIWLPRYDEKKWPELKFSDYKDYIPSGVDRYYED